MKKKEIIGGIIVLFLITSLSGFLLAQVYKVTSPKIEEQKKLEQERLNKEIFPEGVKFELSFYPSPLKGEGKGEGEKRSFFIVYDKNNNEIGKIFDTKSLGYGGDIFIRVGFDNNWKIKGIKILQHNETPGLGAQIVTKEWFLKQFENLVEKDIYLKKDNPEGKIDGITGATISSRAVTEGVRKLLEEVKNEK